MRDPIPHTFEIGLVLAGAVSAGAYTAGVIDYLIERLDAFYKWKADDPDNAPKYDVKIKAIAGASAGSVTGVLAAAQWAGNQPDGETLSKRTWVNNIDITNLLDTSDLDQTADVVSLLDCTIIDRQAEAALQAAPRSKLPPYISEQLDIYLSVANMRGVPYSLKGEGEAGLAHDMRMHADHMHFCLTRDGADPTDGAIPLELANFGLGNAQWRLLSESALASAAFPLGLKPRVLHQDPKNYADRRWSVPKERAKPEVVQGEDGTEEQECHCTEIVQIPTDLPHGQDHEFLCVDGGLMNNEPLELARENLAGPGGRNPRDADKAHRAVIMVDPFPDNLGWNPSYEPDPRLQAVLGQMFTALKNQARFKPDELRLAGEEKVFSRFMIAPKRTEADESQTHPALMSAPLGAFAGFLDQSFRQHDYELGRRNCQKFLATQFVLAAENPVFNGWHSDSGPTSCPILPTAADPAEEQLPGRPEVNVDDLGAIETQIKARLDGLALKAISGLDNRWKRWGAKRVWRMFDDRLRKFVMGKIREELTSLKKT